MPPAHVALPAFAVWVEVVGVYLVYSHSANAHLAGKLGGAALVGDLNGFVPAARWIFLPEPALLWIQGLAPAWSAADRVERSADVVGDRLLVGLHRLDIGTDVVASISVADGLVQSVDQVLHVGRGVGGPAVL
jgi:hypothetical protein